MQTRGEYPRADATAAYTLDLISPSLQSVGQRDTGTAWPCAIRDVQARTDVPRISSEAKTHPR